MRLPLAAVLLPLALVACGPSSKPSDVEKMAAEKGVAGSEAPAAAPPAETSATTPAPSPESAGDPAAAAFQARYTPAYNQCMAGGDAAKGVTTAMVDCIGAELKVQDQKLNVQYATAIHRSTSTQAASLRDAQRQWIRDRDAKCKAAASSGGTIDRLNGPSCLLDETILRTMDLERATPAGPAIATGTTTPPMTAQPPPTKAEVQARRTPHLQHCLDTGDAAKGVTPAMASCFGDEAKLQDGALNAEYQRVYRALPPPQQTALRDAQRRWIRQRDATCDKAASSGGTIDRINHPACLVDETIKRTITLERMGPR